MVDKALAGDAAAAANNALAGALNGDMQSKMLNGAKDAVVGGLADHVQGVWDGRNVLPNGKSASGVNSLENSGIVPKVSIGNDGAIDKGQKIGIDGFTDRAHIKEFKESETEIRVKALEKQVEALQQIIQILLKLQMGDPATGKYLGKPNILPYGPYDRSNPFDDGGKIKPTFPPDRSFPYEQPNPLKGDGGIKDHPRLKSLNSQSFEDGRLEKE